LPPPQARLSGRRIIGPGSSHIDSHLSQCRFCGQPRGGRYCRARYYHPQLQRFISEDPIGFKGGDWNLYAYGRNNLLRYRDPLGLWTFGVGVQLSGTFLGAAASISFGFVVDGHGQIGFVDVGGAGGGVLAGGAAIVQVQGSTATRIQDLAGGGFDLSATVGAPAGPVGQAGWFVGSGYQGASGGAGIGFGFPISVSAEATYTKAACVAFCLAGRKSPPWNPDFLMP
jgi:RHS repeat-associated protein